MAIQEKDILAGGQRIGQGAQILAGISQTAITSNGHCKQYQFLQDCQQRPDKVLEPLGASEAKALTQFGCWNDLRKPEDWDVSPKSLCGRSTLYSDQQGDTARGRESDEQIIHYHSNDRVSESRICERAACGRDPNSMPQAVCKDISPGFESEHLDLGRPEWAYEIPDEYIHEGSQLEFEEDLFTEVSSDYALDSRCTWGYVDGDWSEGRQTIDFGQSCAVVDQQRAVVTGPYPIQGDGYEYAAHNKYELECETDHPRPRRDNFWRRHRP